MTETASKPLMSPAAHLAPDVTLRYGHSLLDFSPRISSVGQVHEVSVLVWVPSIKLQLTVSVGYDWDRQALTVEVTVESAVMRAVIDTGFSSLIALSQGAAEAAGLLDGRAETAGSSIVLGGVARARVIEAKTVTFGDELWRGVATPVFASSPLPNYPDALLGVAAFEDRDVSLDLGRGRLHVSPQMDLTVG